MQFVRLCIIDSGFLTNALAAQNAALAKRIGENPYLNQQGLTVPTWLAGYLAARRHTIGLFSSLFFRTTSR